MRGGLWAVLVGILARFVGRLGSAAHVCRWKTGDRVRAAAREGLEFP